MGVKVGMLRYLIAGVTMGASPLVPGNPGLVTFSIQATVPPTHGVYVVGDHPLIGDGRPEHAVRLLDHGQQSWQIQVAFIAGQPIRHRFFVREDGPPAIGDATTIDWLTDWLVIRSPGASPPHRPMVIRHLGSAVPPGAITVTPAVAPFTEWQPIGPGRDDSQRWWETRGLVPGDALEWLLAFSSNEPGQNSIQKYRTRLASAWIQDGQVFAHRPTAKVSEPRVEKRSIPISTGSSTIYIYTPRGYDENEDRHYPIIYMHDGQNCFQKYVADTAFGTSWRADIIATRLIAEGRIPECIIVGVAHGPNRIVEYLPPYARFMLVNRGTADQTARLYLQEVDPWVRANLRVAPGRENTITIGSSMGGVFATYLAWHHPEFAMHHGVVSPAYWLMRSSSGRIEMLERMRKPPRQPIRLWLDSGTHETAVTLPADDGYRDTMKARDLLLQTGEWTLGANLLHHVAVGAPHSESAWSERLEEILLFLLQHEFPNDSAAIHPGDPSDATVHEAAR
jgi:predicted alpha/beta superfamily hydrolase